MMRNLFLFTVDFPYGNYEATFLPSEVEILSKYYDRLFIIPLKKNTNSIKFKLPLNVEMIDLNTIEIQLNRTFADYVLVLKVFLNELLFSKKFHMLYHSWYHLSEIFTRLVLAKKIEILFKRIDLFGDVTLYTYWFDDWASALSLFKKRSGNKSKFITRAHRFDIYEEQNKFNYIFFRGIQLKAIDKVISISDDGRDYFLKKYPEFADKFYVSKLGITKPNIFEKSKVMENSSIIIVSCSAIVAVKRVNKIIDILKYATKSVKWIHFGSGDMENQILESSQILPNYVERQFYGNVDNEFIINYYARNKIDWFINVSESEGIPVSMMEAISFGIPIIGTDVGGVSEIVNSITGVLIPKEFNPKKVSNIIETKIFTELEREEIKEFWRKHFYSETNYKLFAKLITSF